MVFILSLISVTMISYIFSKLIKKYSSYIYIIVAAISLTTMIHSIIAFNGYQIYYSSWLSQFMKAILSGALGGSIFILVMYMGVMDMKLDFARKLRMNRGELSIIGGLFTIPHNFHYLIKFVIDRDKLVNQQGLSLWTNLMLLASAVFAIVIMIPLLITSFTFFRKKMKAKSWKNLQEYAYIFYALIYIQVMVVYHSKPATLNKYMSMAIYSIIFISYSILKIQRKIENHYKTIQAKQRKDLLIDAGSKI